MSVTTNVDGSLVLHSLRIAENKTPGLTDVLLVFSVLSGLQEYQVWAFDRLALVVYCYAHVAMMSTGDLSDRLGLSLRGTLVSGKEKSCMMLVARSIRWHTSDAVRSVAERLIGEILNGNVPESFMQGAKTLKRRTPPSVQRAVVEKRRSRNR